MTITASPTTLTRIRLNRHNPTARRDLADAFTLHKTLMRLVPDSLGPSPRQQAGLLFRLDHDYDDPTLLIQTAAPPDLTRLPAGYGTAQTRDLTRLLNNLTPGHLIRYRITANATVSRLAPEDRYPGSKKRGTITPLYGEQALAWWHRRAADDAGLHLQTAEATPARPARRSGKPIHVLTRFDGTATITHPHLLLTALTEGIGRGKPYGAGLLTLAPA